MEPILRPGKPADANECGYICYRAFKHIAEQHSFPPDFPNPESAIGLMNFMLSNSAVYSVIAEVNGKIAGSNFLWEHHPIAGIGPITVNPDSQNSTVGRKLMNRVIQRSEEQHFASVRLVQAAYHNRSLSLYTKLGFNVIEPLSVMQGPALHIGFPGYHVRFATPDDMDACNNLSLQIHGHTRGHELLNAINAGTASVVEHNGNITGYAAQVAFFGHAVAETNNDLKALIGASPDYAGPGFLLPSRNAEVLRWSLANGLRIDQPMTLMSKGLYKQPDGAFLPSILY